MIIRLRLLDPGRVRLHIAVRTVIASVLALLVTDAVCRSADLPGGMVIIATVVAVLVSRTLHVTSLAHQLSALLYVPAIGVAAAFTGRFMLHHAWLGAAVFVAAVWASRYLMRFGGRIRRFGRLALTPLISVLVVPVPPSAAKATGPLWGGAAGLIAVACVIAAQAAVPARPTRQAAAAAHDMLHAAARLRALPPGARGRARAARDLHRAALTVEDRLDAARLPADTPRLPLDVLADAVLRAEVRTTPPEPASAPEPPGADLGPAPGAVREAAAEVRRIAARERPAGDAAAPGRRARGWRDPHPQARLSAQLAAAMGAAFAVGHLFFGHRWMWTVITAFVVCGAARGRGDVVHRSGLRVAGAFTGAVTGTLVAHGVAGDRVAAVALIFGYLLVGLWLRDLTYAAWAFCVTSLLAVLYTLNGEHGTALLVQRPEGILLGSACGIAAAFFVLPLRTETVMRGRAARALRALQDLLAAAREPEPRPDALRRLARGFDRAVRDVAEAAAPARAHRGFLGIFGLSDVSDLSDPFGVLGRFRRRAAGQRAAGRGGAGGAHAADWAESLAACAPHARALAAAAPAELAAARPHLGLTALNLGQVRRRLGRRPDAAPPGPVSGGPVALLRLNAVLARLYDQLPAPVHPAVTPVVPASPPVPPSPPAPAPVTR